MRTSRCIKVCGTLMLLMLLAGAGPARAQQESPPKVFPFILEAGRERNRFDVYRDGERITEDTQTYSDTFYEVMSRAWIGCFTERRTTEGEVEGVFLHFDRCLLGTALQLQLTQRRLAGEWPLEIEGSSDRPDFNYVASQLVADVSLGAVDEASGLNVGAGAKYGVRTYDIVISRGDRLFYQDHGESSAFLAYYARIGSPALSTAPARVSLRFQHERQQRNAVRAPVGSSEAPQDVELLAVRDSVALSITFLF